MTTPQPQRLLAAVPLLAIAFFAGGLGRKEVIALARTKFPAVMNRSEPARFLVMVFDSTERYLWGFPVKGSVRFHVSGDTLTLTDRLAIEAGGRGGKALAERKRYSYVHSVPAYVRDSARALHALPMNVDEGLFPTGANSDESGIDGVLARDVVHVDRFALYPNEDPPLQFDIFAVHLDGVRADTGRPVPSKAPTLSVLARPDTTPASVKKGARVKQLVILPMPVPEAVRSYELKACFDVAPNGDAKVLSWTKSLDLDYNSKVKKGLDRYRFLPAMQNGVAVRDTVCIRAKPSERRPGGREP